MFRAFPAIVETITAGDAGLKNGLGYNADLQTFPHPPAIEAMYRSSITRLRITVCVK